MNILSLSLVSRQTLSSSRRVLYQEPFDRCAYQDGDNAVTWSRAHNLLESLEANSNQFGKLVRETCGIDSWIYDLNRAVKKEMVGSTSEDTLSWYHRVLQACTRLQQVDLNLSTEDQLYTALRSLSIHLPVSHALGPSSSHVPLTSNLRKITFGGTPFRWHDTPRISCSQVFSALETSLVRSLDSVSIVGVDWVLEEDTTVICSFPFRIRRLELSFWSDRRLIP